MTEATKSLLYLPMIYLWTGGGADGNVLASLAPPVHLSGERFGWTLLICMVSDLRRGHLEVSWRSPFLDNMSFTPHSVALSSRHRRHSPVSTITVMTNDWPSYTCCVTHRRHRKVTRPHFSATSGSDPGKICSINNYRGDIYIWTNTVVVLCVRLLFLKTVIFNTLMTCYVVMK